MNTFAERLNQKMKERGIKQKYLAEKMKVSPATVSSWCTGRSTPYNKRSYERMAECLGCETEWLMGFAGTETEKADKSLEENLKIKRGGIYYVANDFVGTTDTKTHRPAVVVSSDAGNATSGKIEVVYLTSQPKRNLSTHVAVLCKVPSTAICENVHTVDRNRVGAFIKSCTQYEMDAIDGALILSLGLEAYTHKVHVDQNAVAERDALIEDLKLRLEQRIEDSHADVLLEELRNVKAERDVYKAQFERLLDKITS